MGKVFNTHKAFLPLSLAFITAIIIVDNFLNIHNLQDYILSEKGREKRFDGNQLIVQLYVRGNCQCSNK